MRTKLLSLILVLAAGYLALSSYQREIAFQETLKSLYQREVPGLGELLRTDGANFTPYSWLSRSICGIINQTLIITLPGNPKAVEQGIESLLSILPHALETLQGKSHTHHQEKKCSHG